ncbi:myb domain-containing protein [Tieghemostelium lacteum]|uniref:Myb domain-containing protein n=1 Tax=Tieghemostelium lacteum TaxID=361077 RepID=A0A151Z701_TIELA|nr:myb domain-containing protein [Tieghemostelium lacteum]|eukprot:KYQ89707.1 myb domain-containing protein [Tieghemostelium lacteum]
MNENENNNSIQMNKKRKSDDIDNATDESENETDIIKGNNFKNVKKKNRIDDDADEDMDKSIDDEEEEEEEEDEEQPNNRYGKSKSVRMKSSSKTPSTNADTEDEKADDEQDEDDEDDDEEDEDEEDDDYQDDSMEDSLEKPKRKSKYVKKSNGHSNSNSTSTTNGNGNGNSGNVGSKSTPSGQDQKSKQQKPTVLTRSSTNSQVSNSDATTEETKPATVQYHCDYCQKDISAAVRIRCAICQDFDLCLECFSVGVEITPHKNYHDYTVVDNMHFPMFTQDWGADEELLLLEAIELYGLGNWNDVSENVGTKSAQECKSHYFTYYLNTKTSPLPDTSYCLTTKDTVHFQRAIPSVNSNPNDRFTRDKSKSKTGNKSISSGDHQDGPSGPVTDSVGFMKNRGHFEVEYDNDAELVVKDLTFDQDDTPSDREIKQQLLEGYSQRLDERIRRRDFIVEKGLLDYKRLERKRFKDDKEILNGLKIYLQLLNKDDFEKLVNGTIEEKNLKQKILQLQQYRENGLRYISDGLVFEEEKRKRDQDKSQRRSKSEMSYLSYSEKQSGSQPGGGFKNQKQVFREKEDVFLGIPIPEPAINAKNITGLVGVDRKSSKHPKPKGNFILEMEGLPNVDLLSTKEKQLCYTLRLLPQQYLLVKENFISESLKSNGSLKLQQTLKLSKLPTAKSQKIYEFFIEHNFIKKSSD